MAAFKNKHLQILSYGCNTEWSGKTSEDNLGHSYKSKMTEDTHIIFYCSRKGYSSQKCIRMVNIQTCPDSGIEHDQTSPRCFLKSNILETAIQCQTLLPSSAGK